MSLYLTEAEWLMLSSFGYASLPNERFDSKTGLPIKGQEVKVSDLLSQMRKQATNGGMDSSKFKSESEYQNYLKALDALCEKFKNEDWVVSKSINHNKSNESGFAAFAIEPVPNPDKEVIVCCRGSDAMSVDNLNDWLGADAALLIAMQTEQQAEIKEFMQSFENYEDIYLTGHSLGGNLAMYGAITFKDPNKIKGVYSFDGPGFNPAFVAEYEKRIAELKSRIHNYQNEHDLVSSSLISVGEVVILRTSLDDTNVLTNHNRWAIAVDENGNLIRNESGKKDDACNAWNATSQGASWSLLWPFVLAITLKNYVVAIGELAVKIANEIKKWWDKNFNTGYKYATANPQIALDTYKMKNYAQRLDSVNNRLGNLDSRLDALYWKVGLFDLWNLLHADFKIAKSSRLSKSASYLRNTADEFEKIEAAIAGQVK